MDKLRGYIATVKSRFQPTLTDDAAQLLERHYRKCREVESSTVKTTVRFLESLIRLSQAHARIMYRDIVTLEDAVSVVLLAECSASTLYGLDQAFAEHPVLYRDPMEMEFPPPEEADFDFLCDEYRVLFRYDMLDRLTEQQREEARKCVSDIPSYHPPGGGGGGPDTWRGFEDERVDSSSHYSPHLHQGPARPATTTANQNNDLPTPPQTVEVVDHYGRTHFTPKPTKSPSSYREIRSPSLSRSHHNTLSPVIPPLPSPSPASLQHTETVVEPLPQTGEQEGGGAGSYHDPDEAMVESLKDYASRCSLGVQSSRESLSSGTSFNTDPCDDKGNTERKKKKKKHGPSTKRRRRAAD